jgi:ferric-dicitrate binding protein FerR (iron transport regulator)
VSEPTSFGRAPDDARADPLVADLIRFAGRRPEPAAFRTARVRTVVEAEWRQSIRRRSRWGAWRWGVAAAAVLLLALWLRPPARPLPPPPREIATTIRVEGVARIVQSPSAARPLVAGARLIAGAAIDTTPGGRAALQLGDGVSLRVKHGSRIVLETPSNVRLEQGALYVDTSRSPSANESIEVSTTLGLVHDIGTQFEVNVASESLQIRVREGAVRIDRPDAPVSVSKAEAVSILRNGSVERRRIATHGPEWSWVESTAPQFTVEGAMLESFLQWASRELGLTWRFADAAAERHGKTVVLHGSIDGLTPTEALKAVLRTCGMAYQVRREQLVIALTSQ